MKIALLGYGKMGKTIEALVQSKFPQHEIVLRANTSLEISSSALSKADVAIEFSTPTAVLANVEKCLEAATPVVIGTTGWYAKKKYLKELCDKKQGACLYGSNFSIGMQMAFWMNKELAKKMERFGEYNLQINETHHTEKKDSPSGTAISLAEDAIWQLNRYDKWVNEESKEESVLPIISKREVGVFGFHEVVYTSTIDELKITHNAHSRDGFAFGAIKAAEWLKEKKGFFTIEDFLDF